MAFNKILLISAWLSVLLSVSLAASNTTTIYSLLQSRQDYTFTVQSMELTNLTSLYNNTLLNFTFLASNDTAWENSSANATGALSAAKQNVSGAIDFLGRLLVANTVNQTVRFSSLSSGTTSFVSLAELPLNFTKNSTGDSVEGDPVISPDVAAGNSVVQFLEFLLVPPAPPTTTSAPTSAPTSVAA
ncbi:hypothetical protein GpartN1_g1268.t1 [Galdieria partita]|uniref:FAS1 domain-containing protein n=1 Tax=Galdieria partita TaxID=83374 RepID=A0A9C7PTK1_9RHOD|nr:hypothetical protein GpartN1_g1268.t1 [Galdieria partita]